jgi:hypothetical protein
MLEFPIIQEIVAESLQKAVIGLLEDRFGTIQTTVISAIEAISDEKRLQELIRLAPRCARLEDFSSHL